MKLGGHNLQWWQLSLKELVIDRWIFRGSHRGFAPFWHAQGPHDLGTRMRMNSADPNITWDQCGTNLSSDTFLRHTQLIIPISRYAMVCYPWTLRQVPKACVSKPSLRSHSLWCLENVDGPAWRPQLFCYHLRNHGSNWGHRQLRKALFPKRIGWWSGGKSSIQLLSWSCLS